MLSEVKRISNLKLAAIVVWYYPQRIDNIVQKTLSYASTVKVYIIDNTPFDNSGLAIQVPGADYIPLLKNTGIAAAQNIGCERASKDGFEWVMTMDQDSYFEIGQFESYLQKVNQFSITDEKAVSYSVSIRDDSKQVLPLTTLIKNKLKSFLLEHHYISKTPATTTSMPAIDHPDRVFASANIISLSAWKEVGKFDEALFIDEVDFDFCIRLRMSGYYITRFNTLHLNHKLGNRKFTIFPKTTHHSGKRLYYIIRNKLIENRRYRYALVLHRDYIKEIHRYFKDYCILSWRAPQNWVIFGKAFFAYKTFMKGDRTFLELKEKGLAK